MSDYEVEIVKSPRETSHFHPELEILFVIEGNAIVVVKSTKYKLKKEDILLVNSNTPHTIESMENTIVYRAYLSWKFIGRIVSYRNVLFDADRIFQEISENRVETDLKQIFRELVFQYVRVPGKTRCMEVSLMYQLLNCLIENYELDGGKDINYKDCSEDERLSYTLDYIGKNYMNKISLSDLADKLYTSPSALSRMFKKQTNMYFVDYVNQLRAKYAAREIVYTTENITKIAMDCGFTDVSVLNKNFRKVYGMSPGMYRKQKYEKQITDHSKAEAEMIETYLNQQGAGLDTETGQEKSQAGERRATGSLHVFDVKQTRIIKDPHLKCINAGMAVDLLEAKVQKQIRFAVEELHFQYIRISNIFARELKIRPEHECDNLNFDKLDEIFDFLSDIGVYPFLELPEKQTKYVLDIGTGERIREKETGDVILSGEEWEQLLEQFLRHMIERYTLGTVDRWMFEIAEDIGMQTGAAKNIPYEELYRISYTGIRRYLPNAKIGGCGRNRMMGEEELRKRLLFWKEGEQKPDFLSFMSYPYRIETKEKLDTYKLLEMKADQKFIKEDLEDYKLLMRQVDYPETPIWITEWNT